MLIVSWLCVTLHICFLQEELLCENKATVLKPTNEWLVRLAITRKHLCFIWFIQEDEDRVKRRISFYAWITRDKFHLGAWMEANSALCLWPKWWHVVFWHVQLDFLKNLWLRFQGLSNYHLGQSFEGTVHKTTPAGTVQLGFSDFPWRYGPCCC